MSYFLSLKFLETLIVVVLAVAIVLGSRAFDKKIISTKGQSQKKLKIIKIFMEVINIVLIVMLFVIGLSINGVNVAVAMRSLGIAGIIVGFALNDLLKDIIMGMSIMFEGYYRVGDNVIYNGKLGRIVSFNIKTTKIFLYYTEETLAICNRNITEISKACDWVDIDIPLGYDISAKYARALCRRCASRIERLRYVYSCDFLNTQNLEESWITYKLRIHHLVEKQPMVRRNAIAVVQDVFAEHNVLFPLSVKVIFGEDNYKAAEKGKYSIEQVKTSTSTYVKDYELGRGAEKSKVVAFDGSEEKTKATMKEVERYTIAENLEKKMALRVRLLSEEVLSIAKTFDDMKDGSFYIERSDTDYELVFESYAVMSKERKKALKKATSDAGQVGLTSIIKQAVNNMIKNTLLSDDDQSEAEGENRWSYNVYKEESADYENLMEEGALETSLLSSLADDVRISMMQNKVKMRVLVKNIEEES